MEIEFTTTELITEQEFINTLFNEFGESIHINEGEFRVDPFIDCLKDRAEVTDLCITEKSKKELLQHLKELIIKLANEL